MANQIPIVLSAGRQRQIPNADNLAVMGIVVAQGSITSNRPMLDLSVTLNNAAIDFKCIRIVIVNSNSGPGSLPYELVVDTNSVFSVDMSGGILGNFIEVVGQVLADTLVAITSANIPRLSNLSSNGLVTTTNSNGTLVINTRNKNGYFWHRSCV